MIQKNHKKYITKKLKKLTKRKNIFLTKSGNNAIFQVLKIIKELGVKNIIVQDQGGWLTYNQFIKKLKLNLIEVSTEHGLVNLQDLEKKIKPDSALLVNSLAGYFAEQDMERIGRICSEKTCCLVNDVSGSIGRKSAKYGDLIVGSFGKHKPIDNFYGGFIATIYTNKFDETFDEKNLENLTKNMRKLKSRLKKLVKTSKKIKKDLKNYEILHKNSYSINVIVKYKNPKEKQDIIDYCNRNSFEFRECPLNIRVDENAISIEVKRLKWE